MILGNKVCDQLKPLPRTLSAASEFCAWDWLPEELTEMVLFRATAVLPPPRWRERNPPVDELAIIALYACRFVCRQWLRLLPVPQSTNVAAVIASQGNISLLQWAWDNGCPLDSSTSSMAAKRGHLEVLKWAIERDCTWENATFLMAARGGHLEVLKWVKENGWINEEISYPPKLSLYQEICIEAARGGHLEVLKWVKENGCSWDREERCSRMYDAAAYGGHVEVLKWLRETYPGNLLGETFADAARGGHIETLEWLRENGCTCNSRACYYAAMMGNMRVLNWLKEHEYVGVPGETINYAAAGGKVAVLQWMKDLGYDCWTSATFLVAVLEGQVEVLEWLRENGCPVSKDPYWEAADMGHLNVLKWLKANEVPCDHSRDICARVANAEGRLWVRENVYCPEEKKPEVTVKLFHSARLMLQKEDV